MTSPLVRVRVEALAHVGTALANAGATAASVERTTSVARADLERRWHGPVSERWRDGVQTVTGWAGFVHRAVEDLVAEVGRGAATVAALRAEHERVSLEQRRIDEVLAQTVRRLREAETTERAARARVQDAEARVDGALHAGDVRAEVDARRDLARADGHWHAARRHTQRLHRQLASLEAEQTRHQRRLDELEAEHDRTVEALVDAVRRSPLQAPPPELPAAGFTTVALGRLLPDPGPPGATRGSAWTGSRAVERAVRSLVHAAPIHGAADGHARAGRWAALSADERGWLIDEDPALGDLDGIPPAVRDLVNRRRMTRARAELAAALDAAERTRARQGWWNGLEDLAGDLFPWSDSRGERIEAGRARLDTIDRVLASDSTVLRFDAAADGRLVVAHGDIDQADHVVVLVPGMGTDLGDGGALVRRSERVLARMEAFDPGRRQAVVTWLGYDTPDDVVQARRSRDADQGAPALQGLVAELERLHPPASTVVVAHSYGSVVTGRAMAVADGLDADRVAVVGSPGMGVDDRADLGSPDVLLYAGAHRSDVVRLAPAHGEDPTDDGFGARVFTTDGRAFSHDYFAPGSVSLGNIACIGVGREPNETGDCTH